MLGLAHQKAEVTNSPGSRYNKGKISRMINHIFYTGLSSKENWFAANKNLEISDHMPISAEWNFDSLEIPAKKIKINANRILLAADLLINSNRFSPLIDADMDLDQL
ncbi:hypothetical protein AYI68_g6730, partial [Smittium mucronatum]